MIYIVEINLICLLILIFIYGSIRARGEKQISLSLFKWCVLFAVISVLSDIVFQLIENGGYPSLRHIPFLNYAINLIYYIAAVATAYFWFMYAEFTIDGLVKNRKWAPLIVSIPVFVNILLGILSYWNGILFYINAEGCYERGSMFFINTISCYMYTFVASAHALVRSFATTSLMKKKEYRIIAAYVIFPCAIGILQVFFPNVPTVCVGMAFPILYVYTRLQDLKISTDYLTNLNNRNQLMRFLQNKVKSKPEHMFMFMMDIDKFKAINDTYGHTEGDNALVSAADKLKEVAKKYGGIIARYGGDEFTFVTELPDENTDEVKEQIARKMEEASTNHVFDIRLSVGCAKYEDGMKITELFSKADEALYEDKKSKR